MAAVLKVNTSELERTSGEFNRIYGDVNNLTNDMLSLVKGLHSIYEGEAAEAFIAKALSLENDMNQIKLMIQGHEQELMEIAGIFQQAEAKNVDEANALPSDVI
ncbi:MAG: WXG100 family type VII secretion target [Lachnospiraceae bacterium]|nr:WXG100 family type VII secretion target [Lachnospiraceae bacterium]